MPLWQDNYKGFPFGISDSHRLNSNKSEIVFFALDIGWPLCKGLFNFPFLWQDLSRVS